MLHVPRQNGNELRVDACSPHREGVTGYPQDQTRQPELQAEADRRCERAIADGDRSGRSAE